MTKVLIVYTSSFGNTKRMAEAVTDGARSVESTEVICKEASDETALRRMEKHGVTLTSTNQVMAELANS